jgi:hypothetical protein
LEIIFVIVQIYFLSRLAQNQASLGVVEKLPEKVPKKRRSLEIDPERDSEEIPKERKEKKEKKEKKQKKDKAEK